MVIDTALRVTGSLKRAGWTWSDYVGQAGGWFRDCGDGTELVLYQARLSITEGAKRYFVSRVRLNDGFTIATVSGKTRSEALAAYAAL